MTRPLSRSDTIALRVRAGEIAASFFSENYIPPMHELWAIASFLEAFFLEGSEATAEKYGTAPVKAPAAGKAPITFGLVSKDAPDKNNA